MEEARKDKRVSAEFPVRVKSATVGEFVDRLAADVSLGGIFIQAEPPLDVGTLVRVEFHVDDGTQLCTGVGRVVWNRGEDVATPERPVGMGVKFVRVDTATKDVLSSFVERRASEVSIERRVVVLPESTLSQRPPPEPEEIAAPAAPALEAHAESNDEPAESSADEAPAAASAEAPDEDQASDEAEGTADVSSLAALDARSSAAEEAHEEDEDDEEEDEDEEEAGADEGDGEEEEEDEEEEEVPAAAAAVVAKPARASESAAQAESRRSKKRGKKARKEEARQRKREQKQAAAEVARKEQTEKPKPAKERPSRPQDLPVAQPQSGSKSMLPIIVIVAIIIAIVLGVYFYSSSQSGGDRSPGQETSAD